MSSITYDPNHIWRDGPATAPHHPIKHEIRACLSQVQQILMGLIADAGDLELPNLMIRYTVTGGTADDIVATPNLPVPSGPGLALFSIQIAQDNTGPVTINGKPWLTNVGNQFVAGGIKAGGVYLFLDNGNHYRSITDQDVSALVTAAEAAALEAESARLAAAASAANAAAIVGRAPSMVQLIAANPVSYPVMEVLGFYLAGDWAGARGWGSCRYRWDADEPKANHNGGVIIDPDHSVAPGDTGWWDAENSGTGCWVLERQREINARVFGFRADCQIVEVDYDPDVHSGGFIAQYPYKIHEPDGVLGVDYHDDSRAFKALADWAPSNTTIYWPGGTYFTTNETEVPIPSVIGSDGGTATAFTWMDFGGKENILHVGDYGHTVFFAYQDVTYHSLYMVRNLNSKNIIFRGISFDMQGIGHPNSETHPAVESPITYVQTRFGFMKNRWGDDPDSDEHCNGCIIEDAAYLRLNHPEGAYPGEPYVLEGSCKLILMHNEGRYVTTVSGGPSPEVEKNLVRRCGIRRIGLLHESQSRGVWNWMTDGCFATDILGKRLGGMRPSIMRGTHYVARSLVDNVEAWCENNWKDGSGHYAPVWIQHNNGRYISPGIKLNYTAYRQFGPGLSLNACEDADVDVKVYVDPDNPSGNTSYAYGGINMRVRNTYDGVSDLRGRIADVRIKALIEGGVGAAIEANEDCHFDLRVSDAITAGVFIYGLGDRSSLTGYAKRCAANGVTTSGTGDAWRTAGIRLLQDFLSEDNGARGFTWSGSFARWIYRRTRAIGNVTEGYRSSRYATPVIFQDAYSVGNSAHMSGDSSEPPLTSLGGGAVLIGATNVYPVAS